MAEAYLSGHFLSYCSGLMSKLIGRQTCLPLPERRIKQHGMTGLICTITTVNWVLCGIILLYKCNISRVYNHRTITIFLLSLIVLISALKLLNN